MTATRPPAPSATTVRLVVPAAGAVGTSEGGGDGATNHAPGLGEIAALSTPSRYHALDVVGRGGMGVVRSVFDRVLGRVAAMKSIDGADAGGTEAVYRFLEEAQITGQLDHPSVVPVHDFGIVDGGTNAYFTMKLVRGESLGELIERHHGGGLDVRTLERHLGVFLRVCEGVGFAHSRLVVHRDIKPANILVGDHGEVYVMDWGIALVVDGGRPSERGRADDSFEIVGTPHFMAPEQASGRLADIDARTDVFGLGALLYAILTGRGPFAGSSLELALVMAAEGIVIAPEDVTTHAIPPELSRITMKALSKAPADRYQTVAELARDVQEFLRGGGWFATQRFAAGAVIVHEGDAAGAAYVITHGRCEVYRTSDGNKQLLRTLGPGDVFGETAVFASKPRTATVAALEPVTVKVVTRESLELELERNPWMAAFVRALAERFLELDDRQ